MKNIIVLILSLFMYTCINAQDTGMHFEHNTNWEKVLVKAKAENKYIFVDCFTTWCGPCKMMSTKVFPLESIGAFYNAHYISAKLQMDTTKNDNDEIKNWYATSREFADKYPITAYPTYLIFNQDGGLVFKFVGSMEADSFIANGKAALMSTTIIPENKSYDGLHEYQQGERSTAFLYQLTSNLIEVNNVENHMDVVKDYFSTQTDFYKKENLEILIKLAKESSDTGFKIIIANPQKAQNILGDNRGFYCARSIILNEEFKSIKADIKPTNAIWLNIQKSIEKKYPSISNKAFAFGKNMYYASTHDWEGFVKSMNTFIVKDPTTFMPGELNYNAWTIFKNCNEKSYLLSALNWSKKSFTNQANVAPAWIDTYANILYKLGRKKEALEWETKAQAMAIKGGAGKDWGQDVIDKINKGEKTW